MLKWNIQQGDLYSTDEGDDRQMWDIQIGDITVAQSFDEAIAREIVARMNEPVAVRI